MGRFMEGQWPFFWKTEGEEGIRGPYRSFPSIMYHNNHSSKCCSGSAEEYTLDGPMVIIGSKSETVYQASGMNEDDRSAQNATASIAPGPRSKASKTLRLVTGDK
jgi:hypothetical protein